MNTIRRYYIYKILPMNTEEGFTLAEGVSCTAHAGLAYRNIIVYARMHLL